MSFLFAAYVFAPFLATAIILALTSTKGMVMTARVQAAYHMLLGDNQEAQRYHNRAQALAAQWVDHTPDYVPTPAEYRANIAPTAIMQTSCQPTTTRQPGMTLAYNFAAACDRWARQGLPTVR